MKIDDFILLALKRLYNWYKNTSLPEKKIYIDSETVKCISDQTVP